jgi:hypothetical protein
MDGAKDRGCRQRLSNSPRAREHPAVSTPVTWDEIKFAHKKRKSALLHFETSNVLKRVTKLGDLFAPVLTLKQKTPIFEFAETLSADFVCGFIPCKLPTLTVAGWQIACKPSSPTTLKALTYCGSIDGINLAD